MSEKEIIEENAILAEYLGWIRTGQKFNGYPAFENPKQKGHTSFVFNYDSDWNELMKVVEKIESTDYYPFRTLSFTIIGNYCGIVIDDNQAVHRDVITEKIEDSKIKAVWKACLSFVKEINK